MPGRDGTGPMGNGPLTGRGAGYCAVREAGAGTGFAGRGMSFGCGLGRGEFGRGGRWFACGGGRGLGSRYNQRLRRVDGSQEAYSNNLSQGEEVEILKEQLGEYEAAVKNIQARINELEK